MTYALRPLWGIRRQSCFSAYHSLWQLVVPRPTRDLQQFRLYSSVAGDLRSASFPFSQWCPSEGHSGDLQFLVGYFIGPEYIADLSQAAIVEGADFAHVAPGYSRDSAPNNTSGLTKVLYKQILVLRL